MCLAPSPLTSREDGPRVSAGNRLGLSKDLCTQDRVWKQRPSTARTSYLRMFRGDLPDTWRLKWGLRQSTFRRKPRVRVVGQAQETCPPELSGRDPG